MCLTEEYIETSEWSEKFFWKHFAYALMIHAVPKPELIVQSLAMIEFLFSPAWQLN